MIGHEWAVELLRRHLTSAGVRHAYLFCGADGIGKRTLALRFAQALQCESPPERGEFCGHCRACRLIPRQTYPDLSVVEAESIDGVLKVEQVRQLQRQLALAPYEGRWRIALLLRFHEASASAANALLKTLEEPAPQVVLLLTARSPESLLPTIVSRCEVLSLRALAASELERALQQRVETQEQARLLARLSAGRPGWALNMAQNPAYLERRGEILDDLVALLYESRRERFRYVQRLSRAEKTEESRRQAVEALTIWLSFWRDVMVRAYGGTAASRNPDRAGELTQLAEALEAREALGVLQATRRTLEAIQRYANVRLALETYMLELPHLSVDNDHKEP